MLLSLPLQNEKLGEAANKGDLSKVKELVSQVGVDINCQKFVRGIALLYICTPVRCVL